MCRRIVTEAEDQDPAPPNAARSPAASAPSAAPASAATSSSSASSSSCGHGAVAQASAGGVSTTVVAMSMPGSGATDGPRTVKDSNNEMRRLRHQCKNTLHVSAIVLRNGFGCEVVDAMLHILEPINEWFDKSRTQCKTLRGGIQYRASLAGGDAAGMPALMWGKLIGLPKSVVQFTPLRMRSS